MSYANVNKIQNTHIFTRRKYLYDFNLRLRIYAVKALDFPRYRNIVVNWYF